jgi:hypothetical protein
MKAILAAALFGIPAVLCFLRASRIQQISAVDGVVKKQGPFSRLRLWVMAGACFLALAFVAFAAALDPNFLKL